MPPYRLLVQPLGDRPDGRAAEEHAFDLDQEVVLLGRRPGVDVVLPHPAVGGVHARIERAGGKLVLVDAGAGDTRVGGRTIPAATRTPLADGDEILVARQFRLRLLLTSPEAAATSRAGTHELARKLVRDALAALGRSEPESVPCIEVVAGPGVGTTLALDLPGKDLVLGRGESCDLPLPDPDLSREHLRLRRGWSGTTVVDLGSKNGTLRNDEPLPPAEEVVLRHGDRLVAGATILTYRDPVEDYLAQLAPAEPPPRRWSAVAWIGAAACGVALAGLIWILVS